MAKHTKKVPSIADLKARISRPSTGRTGVQEAVRNMVRTRPRTLAYRQNKWGRGYAGGWNDAIYDLVEISRAADTESLLSVSFRHHRELLLKEGFTLRGKNLSALRVVKTRIAEIEAMSNRTFASIIRDVATDLIKFHTAFIFKRRDGNRSSGGRIRLFGKTLEPIAALEPVDPTSMRVQQNKSGAITKWKQEIAEQGEEVEFFPDEIICITMDRKTGFVFGTPFCLPVLDDILTLRRLEELVDVIATKFAFPLLQYKVGTEKSPSQEYTDENGNFYSEVDLVRDTLGDLPTEGSIVTPERHEIIVLGADGNVLDLKPYLDYFKDRVMNGLRLSGVEVGQSESTSKGSAVVITKNMVDAVKDYQEVLADCISFYLLREILLEEGFDVNDDNMVRLVFAAVDQEEKRAKDNHVMGLYQGHAVTEDEMRMEMDREPLTQTERKRTYLELVEIPLIEAKGKIEVDKAKASAALTANKNRPTNQSGTKPTKTKVKKNDARVEEAWGWGRRMLAEEGHNIDEAVSEALRFATVAKTPYWRRQINEGAKDMGFDLKSDAFDTFAKKLVKKELQKIENKIVSMSRSLNDEVRPVDVFDAMNGVVNRTFASLDVKARAFGMVEAAKENGTTVTIDGQTFSEAKTLALAIQGNDDEATD